MRGGDLCLEPMLPAAAVPALDESAFWGWQFGRQISWVRRQAFHLKETPSSSMATKREYRRYPVRWAERTPTAADRPMPFGRSPAKALDLGPNLGDVSGILRARRQNASREMHRVVVQVSQADAVLL